MVCTRLSVTEFLFSERENTANLVVLLRLSLMFDSIISKSYNLLLDFYHWYGELPSTDEKIDNEVLSRIENILEVLK